MGNDDSEDDRLFEEAMDLVIRLQNDSDNPVAQDMVRRWRARSNAHERAWAEVVEIHGMTGKILADRQETDRAERIAPTRRNFMIVGMLCLGAAAAGGAVIPGMLARNRADFTTGTAEIKRISLPDGSVATLGPDTGIKLAFTEARRDVQLLYGMVFVDVAKDADRPFAVAAEDVVATALGTAYEVSNDSGFLTVSVDHGVVKVGTPAIEDQRLEAGQWLRFDRNSKRVDRGVHEVEQIAAWRGGMIVADKEPISAVVARIERWQKGEVLIADPSLGSLPISGVFDLKHPIRALEAVVQPYGGKVRQISPWLTVISKI